MDDQVIANHFNDYFSSVANNLLNYIPNSPTHFSQYFGMSNKNSIFLTPTTTQEIKCIISTFKSKCWY